MAAEGRSNVMVAVRSSEIVPVPLEEAVASVRGVPRQLYDTAQTFFG